MSVPVINQTNPEPVSSSRSCPGTPTEKNEQQESSSFSHQDEVVPFHTEPEESSALFQGQPVVPEDDLLLPEVPDDNVTMQAIIEALLKEELNRSAKNYVHIY